MLDFKRKAQEILDIAGIKINGDKPWDIKVYNEDVYERVLKGGTLAFGESYMDGWWDVEDLELFFEKVLKAKLDEKINKWSLLPYYLKSLIINPQKKRSYEVGKAHYDIGNDLYKNMLDKRMTYTCAYWDAFQELPEAKNLDEAQEHKLEMVCRKLGLKKGDRVLDIGCGWGSFIIYAAEKYGVECVGVTVSKEQVKYGNEIKGNLPVEFRYQDYREINEKFDHIVSLGMFEHVGYKNYRTYMEVVNRCLKDDGLFLLQTIGSPVSVYSVDPWIEKYIFPNSMLPSLAQISKACENLFVIEDVHNFGYQYYLTLMAWYDNFIKAWPKLKKNYDERFFRMWKFYLLSSAAGFSIRMHQLWQIVFSKDGVKGGYKSIR